MDVATRIAGALMLALGTASAASAGPAAAPQAPAAAKVTDGPMLLRVMTFNLWYGGDQVDIYKVAEAIRAADADIVGLQESDGNILRIAELAHMPYVDRRRRIIARFPIFDPGTGERTETDPAPYSTTALDRDKLAAWVMVRPGKIVAMANTHLSSDPSGLEIARTGRSPAEVLALENRLRLPEAKPLTALAKLGATGIPVFLTGDFNAPSDLDWTAEAQRMRHDFPYPLQWPVSHLLEQAGLRDSYREAHPDAGQEPGITWSPGTPSPILPGSPGLDRIDFIYAAGNSQTIDSTVVGEPGGAQVGVAVAPWPSDHRAVVSTFRVVPADAPAMLSVTPRGVAEGGSIMLRTWTPAGGKWTALVVPRGAGPDKAITGTRDMVDYWQRAIRLPVFGIAPGEYDAILIGEDGKLLKRTAFTVLARDAKPELTAPASVAHGAPLALRWRNAPGDLRDWIAVYRRGEADVVAYKVSAYTDAHFAGTLTLPTGDLPPGDYEARLMADETFVTLARAAFTVTR